MIQSNILYWRLEQGQALKLLPTPGIYPLAYLASSKARHAFSNQVPYCILSCYIYLRLSTLPLILKRDQQSKDTIESKKKISCI